MQTTEAAWQDAMKHGRHDIAWAISDAVLAGRDPAGRDDPAQPYHRRWVWDGRPFRGRHVLVRCYHGLGDTLQFARFLPALRPLVASLTLEVQPALLPLLAAQPDLAKPDRLVGFRPDAPLPASECDLEIMELSHALRLPPASVPPPYLQVAAKEGLPEGTIGLCWQAGDWDPARAVPSATLAPLLRHRRRHRRPRPGVSLQPGPAALPVLNRHGCPPDIAGTARLLAGTACVVTVDTMVAHLAGALGHPTRLLLKHDADWRWAAGAASPWYPTTRLYRQPAPGQWAPALARLERDLLQEEAQQERAGTPRLRPAPAG